MAQGMSQHIINVHELESKNDANDANDASFTASTRFLLATMEKADFTDSLDSNQSRINIIRE